MKLYNFLYKDHYRLLIVGGGTSGCAVASKFSRILKSKEIAVIEPNTKHYYQPGYTFVGSGIFTLKNITRQEGDVLPKNVVWLQDHVKEFYPEENRVDLSDKSIFYDFLVIGTGLELRYDLIDGLTNDVLKTAPGICSIYSPKYVNRVFDESNKIESGNAIFTFPNTPIKCAGAPQKICYLTEDRFRKNGKRANVHFIYNTSLSQVFAVKKYSNALMKNVIQKRNIELNIRHNLKKVDINNKIATFEILDENLKPTEKLKDFKYSFLHIAPPCSPIKVLRETKANNLVNSLGWVNVNTETLQAKNYSNIFAIGDCADLPVSKTAAAISSQFKTLSINLHAAMQNLPVQHKYDGYTSCPLVIDSKHVILAEFTPSGPLETFPYNQEKPSKFAFFLKKYFMEKLYWYFLLRGFWTGPATMRKIFSLIKVKKD